ncbi:holothin acyltransferase-like [Lineus longissimus]|uniref:holothin acyltransferase-like n=1 Tax=Lineus longissimus TaxID=88925 RepID=UPI002B4EBF2A
MSSNSIKDISKDLKTEVVVRQSTERAEWEELLRLTNEENWNYTISDFEVYFRCDPEGVFVALIDGKPVGFTVAINWSDEIAVGGLSIVNKRYRGQGIGKALWSERIKHIGDRSFMLFSVQNRVEANMRLGFKVELCRMHIMCGKVNKKTISVSRAGIDHHCIVHFKEGHFDRILAYDNLIHYIKPREAFLRLWFAKDEARVAVAMTGDRVVGYGCIYPTSEGYIIGPLYADAGDIAADLLGRLLETVPEPEPEISMFVFNDNAGFQLAKELNMSFRSQNDAAMCTKKIRYKTDQIYATFGPSLTFV